MESDVYHIYLDTSDLPSDPSDYPAFARSKVRALTGPNADGIDFSLEQAPDDETLHIVLTVPQRLTDVTRDLTAAGLAPLHTEPEYPMANDNSCIIPRSFQVRCFGAPIEPLALNDNPSALHAVSNALLDRHSDHLPPEALDPHHWVTTESDPETQVLTIYW